MALSSTKIIKVLVVTDDLDKTVAAYRQLFGTGTAPVDDEASHNNIRTPYKKYLGKDITDTPMKVESVFSDNFWFEIIQPYTEDSPWGAWLKEHGTSICSVCLMSDGPLEADEEVMKQAGFGSLFIEEKGYEAYEYFDTGAVLGVMTEVKEHY